MCDITRKQVSHVYKLKKVLKIQKAQIISEKWI